MSQYKKISTINLSKNSTVHTGNALKDRHILITGAASGLGQAIAVDCARHGAEVLLVAQEADHLNATVEAISNLDAPVPLELTLDLQRAGENEYQHLGEIINIECGKLDGLVHCAAADANALPLQFQDLGSWQRILQVNLTAAFALTNACIPALLEASMASVVFTTASSARETTAFQGAFGITGHAIEAMMQTYALELAKTANICFSSVNPGTFDSALRRQRFPTQDPRALPLPTSLTSAFLVLLATPDMTNNGVAWEL